MTKLLGIRTVYNVDPTKTFRIADILEAGAILPRSVNIADLMVMDLEADDATCPVHGESQAIDTEDYQADYRERNELYLMGNGG